MNGSPQAPDALTAYAAGWRDAAIIIARTCSSREAVLDLVRQLDELRFEQLHEAADDLGRPRLPVDTCVSELGSALDESFAWTFNARVILLAALDRAVVERLLAETR